MRAHWLDDGNAITPETLRTEGVLYERLPLEGYRPAVDALKAERGYVQEDEVRLQPTTPNLEAICAKFIDEHLHDEDEVRFILAGEGVFDVRSRDDRYMRILVEAADLIVVPAKRYHRFMLTDGRNIHAVRLFQDKSGWVPHYR
jgi:1,2-dihydroxy-3-keto-5-methylthiopentene dioxygenase